ncbi:hypothetical protein HMPREF1868_02076 [Olsenella sp. DNF00959]|nr:hypothetical protein HMPREF1868_02076 [Olsenella sp. DNF00959]
MAVLAGHEQRRCYLIGEGQRPGRKAGPSGTTSAPQMPRPV